MNRYLFIVSLSVTFFLGSELTNHKGVCSPLQLRGVAITPHVQSHEMRYRKPVDFSLGARTQVFVTNHTKESITLNAETPVHIRNKTPEELLEADEWSWYDFPGAWNDHSITLPPGAMTVWTWNGKRADWGVGTNAEMTVELNESERNPKTSSFDIAMATPEVWLSSITFLGKEQSLYPDRCVFHIANQSEMNWRIESIRLWLPQDPSSWQTLLPQQPMVEWVSFPENAVIPAGDRGGAIVHTGPLPLTYTAVEVTLRDSRDEPLVLWAHLRIKKEVMDISGGWVSSNVDGKSTLTFEPFLQTLRRMHINTAHIGEVNGYTDDPQLFSRYPLKRFNKLNDFSRYDEDTLLSQIHAVEFLGEPQYGGGTPVPPMDVWRQLAPYQRTRLTTTLTHSEERIWRYYAGLSDYPHYDAYRVCAPSADGWNLYDRWGEHRIRWGAPLETIGVMTRNLRELHRPVPIAYWSQGAHHNWGHYGGRQRTSPTPKELRAQAYHALSARITSLYWFNLSLKSILKFPDLIEPITRIGREIRLLESYYLEGDAYHYERVARNDQPAWDVSVIAGPRGALLFVLDLAYQANHQEKIFEFSEPRKDGLFFPLPTYLQNPQAVYQVDAEDIYSAPFENAPHGIRLQHVFGDVTVFVVTHDEKTEEQITHRLQALKQQEASFGFDPASNPSHLLQLKQILYEAN